MDNYTVAIIKKIDNKYYVYSHDGKKKLGGPYSTRKAALKRLRQIEFFKQNKGKSEYMDENKVRLFSIAAEIVDPDKIKPNVVDDLVSAEKIERPNEDLLYMRFVLCHQGINDNRDEFLIEELQDNYDTIKYKDVNIEHSDKIVGCIYDADLIEEEDKSVFAFTDGFKPHVVCSSVLYKYKYPESAKEVIKRHKEKKLTFSMETWFKTAECSACGESFEKVEDYCEHLNNRLSSAKVSRRLRGITFGGAGIVEKPADKDARGLSVAEFNDDTINWIVDSLDADFDNLNKVINEFVTRLEQNELIDQSKIQEKFNNLLNSFVKIENNSNSVKGGKYTVEFKTIEDALNDPKIQEAIENKVNEKLEAMDKEGRLTEANTKIKDLEKKLEDNNKEVEKLQAEKEKAKKDFEEYKKEQEVTKMVDERYKEITDAGWKAEDEDEEAFVKEELKVKDDESYAKYKKILLKNVKAEEDTNKNKNKSKGSKILNVASNYEDNNNGKDEFEWESDFNSALGSLVGQSKVEDPA